MPNESKPIWNILCAKSERERSKAGLLFDKMKKRKQALDRKEKLELMLEEYNQTLNGVLKKSQTKHEASTYRQFIVQLQKLLVFAESTLASANKEYDFAKSEFIKADLEKRKLQIFGGQNFLRENWFLSKVKAENRVVESINLIRHNINSLKSIVKK